MSKKVFSYTWSFSSMKMFDQCPKKYYHLKVAKDYEEDFNTEAILYGNQFHEAAEGYIRDGGKLDPRFKYAKKALDKLNAIPGTKLCEYKMGLTEDLEPCGFFDENVWWRGVVDLAIIDEDKGEARVIDYKTGKSVRYADTGQLELMTLAIFKHFPQITRVKAGLLFVVCRELVKEVYDTNDKPKLWKKWLRKCSTLEKTYKNKVWNPKQSGLCRAHCIILECPHNGRGE